MLRYGTLRHFVLDLLGDKSPISATKKKKNQTKTPYRATRYLPTKLVATTPGGVFFFWWSSKTCLQVEEQLEHGVDLSLWN